VVEVMAMSVVALFVEVIGVIANIVLGGLRKDVGREGFDFHGETILGRRAGAFRGHFFGSEQKSVVLNASAGYGVLTHHKRVSRSDQGSTAAGLVCPGFAHPYLLPLR
jgi:hypothetical protein